MSQPKKRVAVLISGRGSNMMSLVEASGTTGSSVEIAAVISNRADAAGIAWARERGLATGVVPHRAFDNRRAFEEALQAEIENHAVDIIALAGFMRILGAAFVSRWEGRMLNIHPSLLPAFKGLNTHEQALEAGVKIAGCTVHFVTPEMDAGPIIAQAAVPVCDADTPATLADRILAVEHQLYPMAMMLVASGRTRLVDGRVVHDGDVNQAGVLFSPEPA